MMHLVSDWRYPAIMITALLLCSLLLRRTQRGLKLRGREKLGIGVGAYLGAMLGAKLPFVLADWDGMLSGAAWLSHGKTIMAGIVGGYFGVELAKWALHIRAKTGDTFVVPIAVAVAVGRVGCFVGGCCFGQPTDLPWGVVFPGAGDVLPVARHPTQLYEAMFHLVAAGVFLVLGAYEVFPRQRMKLYLLSYLVFRFITEWLRPEIQLWGGLTGYQWAALALVPLFVWLWWRDARALRLGAVDEG